MYYWILKLMDWTEPQELPAIFTATWWTLWHGALLPVRVRSLGCPGGNMTALVEAEAGQVFGVEPTKLHRTKTLAAEYFADELKAQ